MKNSLNMRISITDKILAIIFILIFFSIGFLTLDNNCDWGDDFAAYMSDGIAIANNRYKEQILINPILRYGFIDSERTHVHSFGLPLLFSLVDRLCGFDTVSFNNIFAYKIPSLLFFSVMAGVFYLFLRQSFGRALSYFVCMMLCSYTGFSYAIRNLGNDILFLSLFVFSIYLNDLFLYNDEKRKIYGVFLGIIFWFAYSVRLNGISVILACLLSLIFLRAKKKQHLNRTDSLPYICFIILFLVFNCWIFPKPTSTSSLISDFSTARLLEGLSYYFTQLEAWSSNIIRNMLIAPLELVLSLIFPGKNPITFYSYLSIIFTASFWLLVLLGIAIGISSRNAHLFIFAVFTFLVSASLSLGQELRYLYTILPCILLYFGFGVSFCGKYIGKIVRIGVINAITAFLLCIFLLLPSIKMGLENIYNDSRENLTAYSNSSVEIYNYISNETPEDCLITFFKPRALYLNTGRLSVLPGKKGFDMSEPDYYLAYKPYPGQENDEILSSGEFDLIFENHEFALYSAINNSASSQKNQELK